MKMYSYVCLIILSIFVFIFAGCTSKQASSTLEVNGVAAEITHFEAEYDGSYLGFFAKQGSPNPATFIIRVFIDGPGTYTLNDGTYIYNNRKYTIRGNIAHYTRESITYYTNAIYTGTVTITSIDVENKIVSGTFEYRAAQRLVESKVINIKGSFEDVPIEINLNKYTAAF
jgi:hypothetical protein